MTYPAGLTATGTRMREQLNSPSHGSRTLTVENTEEEPSSRENTPQPDDSIGVLRLRGDMTARRPPVVRWDDDVVDNEHMGKKKSKICCIYHKPREVGESSDSDSSSSNSDSSSGEDDSDSDHRNNPNHSRHCHRHRHGQKKKRNPRHVSPNAYERQPVYKNRPQPSSTSNNN
ncbi:phosphatase inhibitor-domain-containing protein [Halteromyces radiatus]|uniref:phosphatase inhibitor-domain-containing protein n=1 Tax=Halteromyces radiatus TaxID=101107 RepID=UPI00221F7E4E|nr:phosphatase inhibitor-domain-containing protein [Halteromyces radiatus]KAI8089579.1 phosphatase inhibitor-domain-containing protein [Halteromyces radiatus]